MLPDGLRFLYYQLEAATRGVYAFDPERKETRLVVASETEAVFVEPSSLVFAQGGNLVIQPFDAERLELTGSPKPIAPGVQWDARRASLNMGISARGALVYQPVVRAATVKLAWMDRKGERTPLPIAPFALGSLTLSSDGRRAAVNLVGSRGESPLAVLDLERGVLTSIGDADAKFYYGALISKDGQRIFSTHDHGSGQSLVSFPFGGGAPVHLLEGEPTFEYGLSSVTLDGRSLLFTMAPKRDKIGDIAVLDLGGKSTVRPLMATPEAEWGPLLSPSGDVVAYGVSNEEETTAWLKVVAYPTPSAPVQVSANRILSNLGWLSDGELCWLDPSRNVWSATVSSANHQLDVSSPKPMFDGRPLGKEITVVASDPPRERFLIALEETAREEPQLIFVSDWRSAAAATESARR
jgi:hypothetical protein